jgi:hypothetical protein
MRVSVRGRLHVPALIKVDHHQGVKMGIPFKDRVVADGHTTVITILREAPKDQTTMLTCEDLMEAQIGNHLQKDLQVMLP